MTIQALDISPTVSNQRFSSELDGTIYVFDLRWNDRAGAWFMDVLEEDLTPIRHGIKLVLGALVGSDTKDSRFPPGRFLLEDKTGEGVEATLEDLGTRVILYYFSEEELT